jgi:hypothetical protein
MKKASPPPVSSSNSNSNSNGKAKQTARSKQLAHGTSSSSSSHSPKISSTKIKTEPYIPSIGGGPSVGPAYDGTGKPYYPAYGHSSVPQYSHYGNQQGSQGYYAYQPIAYGHSYGQPPQWGPSPYGASNPSRAASGSPASQNDHSPQVSATGYHGYPYPSPYSQQGMPTAHGYAPSQGDFKPYAGMYPPHTSTHHGGPGFPQSDERPHTQGSHGSQASYDGKLSPDTGDRADSVELSPRH